MTFINQVNAALISEGVFNLTSEITNLNMAAEQWATGSLTNNSALAINATYFNPVSSAKFIGMNFLNQPEITQSGCSVSFTRQDALNLFN